MRQPPAIVGVTALHGDKAWIERNTQNYLNTLARYGAQSVVLSPDRPARLPDGREVAPTPEGRLSASILDELDGLVLSGGGDVAPHHFGQKLCGAEPENIDPARDELELTLARAALAHDLPIFGICRGCQVLNVAAGGSMIQHFGGHRSPKDATAFHAVRVQPESRLHQITGRAVLRVNTFHHQGMDIASMARSFVPTALADPDSWLVEAFESPTHRWAMGVQWHPERSFELDESHQALWDSFAAACQQRAMRRRP